MWVKFYTIRAGDRKQGIYNWWPNTIIVFCRPFSFHTIGVYTGACIQSQFSGTCDYCAYGFKPVNWKLQVRGLKAKYQISDACMVEIQRRSK